MKRANHAVRGFYQLGHVVQDALDTAPFVGHVILRVPGVFDKV